MKIELSEEEARALLVCLDAAVRARGLELAKAAAVLEQKIEGGGEPPHPTLSPSGEGIGKVKRKGF